MKFLEDDALVSARRLLGARLRRGSVAVEITEVEAYLGEDDPASHAWKGPSKRNLVMFGPPAHLYCYTMHGHTCCNVVCSAEGLASAVLIRAGRVVEGIDDARSRRPGVPDERLARGPGNLTKALGITMVDAGASLFDEASSVRLTPGRTHVDVSSGPRVGVSRAADVPWRFWVTGDPTVSAYRRAKAAGTARA